MAKQDEISSTERLLTLIRRKDDAKRRTANLPSARSQRKKKRASRKKRLGTRGTATLGVDFSRTDMKLALVSYTGDKQPVLTRYGSFAYEQGLSAQSPRFPVFLKSTLDAFCGARRRVNIWCTIPSTNVETRFLRIPKVPKKQITNTVFWSHKRESNIDEKESIFDFELLGETVREGVQRIEVISYTAPRQDVEQLKKSFAKAGHPLSGVSIVPFALQNLFRTGWTETGGKNVCTLFIGTDWSRIAIFSDKNLVLSRDIKAGLQSMIETIADELGKMQPEVAMAMDGDEKLVMADSADDQSQPSGGLARRILDGFIQDDLSVVAGETGLNLNAENVFDMISPALDRVVRQVERTLDHYYLNYENERVNNVYISGAICSHKRSVLHIGEQLGLPVDFIDPFYTELPEAVDVLVPESVHERGEYLPVMGNALASNQRTPNFLFTYKDKIRVEKNARFNQFVFGISILLMLVCCGYFAWQSNRLDLKKNQVVQLRQQLERYIPVVDQNMVLQMAAHAFSERQSVDGFAEKYKGMAVLREIAGITPDNVRLAGIDIQLGGVRLKKASKDDVRQKNILIEGIISGNRLNFESALAGYMVKLERSPMFGRPEIIKQSFEVVDEKEVLKFSAQVDII